MNTFQCHINAALSRFILLFINHNLAGMDFFCRDRPDTLENKGKRKFSSLLLIDLVDNLSQQTHTYFSHFYILDDLIANIIMIFSLLVLFLII